MTADPGPGALRVAVVGGGPGGLYAAALLKRLDPAREITVWERNAPDDTFGFGVVLSDETLGGIEHADPVVYAALQEEFVRWDDIDIVHRGVPAHLRRPRLRRPGPPPAARDPAPSAAAPSGSICASAPRRRPPPTCAVARPGDRRRRGGQRHPRGPRRRLPPAVDRPPLPLHLAGRRLRLRRLPLRDRRDRTRRDAAARLPLRGRRLHRHRRDARGGLAGGRLRRTSTRAPPWSAAPRSSRTPSAAARCASNTSTWTRFRTVVNARWSHGNMVLLGDAAHTAHFSIGSGTKLAVEDALALAACLQEQPDLAPALAAYEEERRPVVASTQRAARASLEWFEDVDRRLDQPATPVRLQPAHPQPPRHPRQPAAARPALHRPPSSGSSAARPARRRCSPRSGCAV